MFCLSHWVIKQFKFLRSHKIIRPEYLITCNPALIFMSLKSFDSGRFSCCAVQSINCITISLMKQRTFCLTVAESWRRIMASTATWRCCSHSLRPWPALKPRWLWYLPSLAASWTGTRRTQTARATSHMKIQVTVTFFGASHCKEVAV